MTFDIGLHEVCVRVGVRYVITRFSRMVSLPNFVTHGATLRALRARELRNEIVANVTRAKALIINIISNSVRNTANQMFLVISVILRASPVFFLSCFLIVSELRKK